MNQLAGTGGPAEGPVPRRPLGLWQAYGVEIEMMIVDRESLDVRPVADRLFRAVAGDADAEIEVGGIGWSNELALHVLELKTHGPAPRLEGLGGRFHESVRRADELLEPLGCRLLPGGAHPWMDPETDFRIWPHEYTEVYRTFDRIFSCRGHGWANLQSTHLNLPFADDREFALLHEAVRLVLPLVPALAASSPILDGRVGPALDNRLLAYRDNARRVPSVTGRVVPERVSGEDEYRRIVLEPIYRDLAPHDPDGVLREEWVNARGAIARFQRGTVEIRVVDAQESPVADLAVTAAVAAAVRRAARILDEGGRSIGAARAPRTGDLAALLDRTIRLGGRAEVAPVGYRDLLGLGVAAPTAGAVWAAFLEDTLLGEDSPEAREWGHPLRLVLDRGTLAERILAALGPEAGRPGVRPGPDRLREVYGRLADALRLGTVFVD